MPRARLWLHLKICVSCRRVDTHMDLMRQALEKGLNRELSGGRLRGTVRQLSLQDLAVQTASLSVRFKTEGTLRYEARADVAVRSDRRDRRSISGHRGDDGSKCIHVGMHVSRGKPYFKSAALMAGPQSFTCVATNPAKSAELIFTVVMPNSSNFLTTAGSFIWAGSGQYGMA